MADVVKAMQPLPDSDIRAMANYLASLNADAAPDKADAQREAAIAASNAARTEAARISPRGERLFNGACASCHGDDKILSSLALNSNLHANTPDNLLQALWNGVEAPAILAQTTGREAPEVMSMPSFRQTLDQRQLEDLAAYVRARFAPDKPAWDDFAAAMQRVTRHRIEGFVVQQQSHLERPGEDIFRKPPHAFMPSAYWFWHSVPDEATCRAQLADFKAQGFGTVLIQARLAMPIADYLSPSFIAAYQCAIAIAAELGLKIGIYDDYNWISGHAGGRTVAEHDHLRERHLFWSAGSDREGTISGIRPPFVEGMGPDILAWQMRGAGSNGASGRSRQRS